MTVLSVNISKSQRIIVNGKEENTGYFKNPIDESIFLGKTDVKNDVVIDRKYHGGIDKACYLYGFNHYDFWKNQYPNLDFNYGMFGENITLSSLDESVLKIGDTFDIGEARIQITQPRQPCYKMGIKFNNQKVVKQFRLGNSPGIYVKVLKEGKVKKGDELILFKSYENSQTVLEIYQLIYEQKPSKEAVTKAINNEFLATNLRDNLLIKLTK